MNVIIQINGREAIPVRAIPFLTDWEEMAPDAIAAALGSSWRNAFTGLVAYRRNGENPKDIPTRWWRNNVEPDLEALQDLIQNQQITPATGYVAWKPKALNLLPASVFVWRDEFVSRYGRHSAKTGLNEALDFTPDVPAIFESLIAEGFEDLLPAPNMRTIDNTPPKQKAAPVAVVTLDDEVQSIEQIRYEVLASRTELIEAFSLYGVELKIFKALKDRPGLMAACRVKGKGQRGSRAEPMFCPFEVINWLVKTGVKEKPRLNEFSGWHILETKFPNVYAEKSMCDPR